MAHAMRAHQTGEAEVLTWESVEVSDPGPARCAYAHAIGVNFIDTYHRSGLYPTPLPLVLGDEAAGEVEAVGSGVNDFAVGDRGAYGAPSAATPRHG